MITKRFRTAALATMMFVILCIPAFATTYYVSSSTGNDSNPGTTTSAPWKSMSKVNSTSFSPGDSVLLRRGDIWINEPLIVPSSGTKANPITFGAYGSGPRPILDGDNREHWAGLVRALEKSWIIIQDMEIRNVGKQCVYVEAPSTGVIVRNCHIHTNSVEGYMLVSVRALDTLGGVTEFTFDNNLVHDGKWNGIRLNGGVTNSTISNNTFHTLYHHGIDAYPAGVNNSGLRIFGNDIYRINNGGIYLPATDNSEIYENDIHDDWKDGRPSVSSEKSIGIKLDDHVRGGSNNVIRNNRIWNITKADSNNYALWIAGSSNNAVYNNTIYNSYRTVLIERNPGLMLENNLAYGNAHDTAALRNFGSDPMFVNPTGSEPDFRLRPGSPAIDAGVNVGLPFNGPAPDLGADEYASSATPTPPQAPSGLRILSSY